MPHKGAGCSSKGRSILAEGSRDKSLLSLTSGWHSAFCAPHWWHYLGHTLSCDRTHGLKYPYQYGQAQEDLRDLYGVMVVRPGHQSASHLSTTAEQTKEACTTGIPIGIISVRQTLICMPNQWGSCKNPIKVGCLSLVPIWNVLRWGIWHYISRLWNSGILSTWQLPPHTPVWRTLTAKCRLGQHQTRWMCCSIIYARNIPRCTMTVSGLA